MVASVSGVGSAGSIGPVSSLTMSIAPSVSGAPGNSPSDMTTVSLGNTPTKTLFGIGAVKGADAYKAVQAVSNSKFDVNSIALQTGLSPEFITGFVSGLQMSNQVWVDKLTEALILALLEQSKTHNG